MEVNTLDKLRGNKVVLKHTVSQDLFCLLHEGFHQLKLIFFFSEA